jgi:CBS domain-containing protein
MPLGIKVEEVMRTHVVTAKPEETALTAARRMKERDVGSVIVVEDNKPIGIVTREDITIKVAAENKLASDVLVKDIMNQPVVTCKKDDDIIDVAHVMNKYGYERLPVVDENNQLVGIISIREILAIAPGVIEVFKERLEARLQGDQPPENFEERVMEGECEVCGNYSEELRNINGLWICSECAENEGFSVPEE